ncbi:MAG TPA: hypothetical protein VKR05_00195 [Candidatus Cybelea sp.]|nr:hypothetical protein [Candidatus Cybelea sp.]
MKPTFIPAGLAAGLALAAALGASQSLVPPAAAATPPPTPPPMDAPASPAPATPSATFGLPLASASPGAAPGASATASPTPPPDARKGIEGVWEVQIQRPNTTDYTHFKLAQSGNTLSGTYLDAAGKKFPLAGSVDGQQVRMIVSLADGTTLLLEGRLDGTTDIIGMLTSSKESLPFTAAYRPKEKWIENVNASPGGVGMPNGPGSPGTYGPP